MTDESYRWFFSRMEVQHLAVSTAVLIIAFTIAYYDLLTNILANNLRAMEFLFDLCIVTAVVVQSVALREILVKYAAKRSGCIAEYRYVAPGLALAVITGIPGFVFAPVGKRQFSGCKSRRDEGRICASGLAVHLVLAALFLGWWHFMPVDWLVNMVALYGAWTNVWIAGASMVPVPRLDGHKIIGWNIIAYLMLSLSTLIIAALLLAL